MTLAELMEKRAAKIGRMKSLLAGAETHGGDLTDGERTEYEAAENEVRALNVQIERAQRFAELERGASATPINGTPDFDRECRSYSLLRAIAGRAGLDVDFGREREVSSELARRSGQAPEGIYAPTSIFQVPAHEARVLISTTSGAGIIPTDHRDDLTIDLLRARSVVNLLGSTVLSGLQGNLSIPSADAAPVAAWVAENGALSAADYDLNARTMSPKHVGMLTEVSRNMIQQSSPDVEMLVRSDFARGLAAALDSAALVGGGSNQPSGIIDRLTDASALGTWAGPTWDQGLELMVGPEANNVPGSRTGWALHPRAVKKLRSTLVAASTDSRMIMDAPNSLYGHTAQATGHAALFGGSPEAGIAAAIYGAGWEHLLVGYWSQFDVLVNPFGTGFDKGNVQIRGMLTADVQVRHLAAFAAATDMPTP